MALDNDMVERAIFIRGNGKRCQRIIQKKALSRIIAVSQTIAASMQIHRQIP